MEQVVRSGVKAGDIIEYNSIVLAAEVEQWGGVATRYPIVIDNFEAIKAAVQDAASKYDLVSSTRDHRQAAKTSPRASCKSWVRCLSMVSPSVPVILSSWA